MKKKFPLILYTNGNENEEEEKSIINDAKFPMSDSFFHIGEEKK